MLGMLLKTGPRWLILNQSYVDVTSNVFDGFCLKCISHESGSSVETRVVGTHPAAPVTIAFLLWSLPIWRLFRVWTPPLLEEPGADMTKAK